MSEVKQRSTLTVVADRAVYTTRKHRAEDLAIGDVIRNRFGKWDVVTDVSVSGPHYMDVHFEVSPSMLVRTVALVDVQAVKPS